MLPFIIRFFICNLFLSIVFALWIILKRLLLNFISPKTLHKIWFLFLCLLIIPFLPIHLATPIRFLNLIFHLNQHPSETGINVVGRFDPSRVDSSTRSWSNDFTVSVSRAIPNFFAVALYFIWIVGILILSIHFIISAYKLYSIKKASLPLKKKSMLLLFYECSSFLQIKRDIRLYSSAFLQSPITLGILQPKIYIPMHLISDYCEEDMRFIFLHELQHCKQHDSFFNSMMNLASLFYWFNPIIWYAFREIRTDREIACDSAVLQCLSPCEYILYGNTLINFAEKISLSPFTLSNSLGGDSIQLKKRVLNISSYKPFSFFRKIFDLGIYLLIMLLLSCLIPFLSTYLTTHEYYPFHTSEVVSPCDLSSHFGGYAGSFVLYDAKNHTWKIYNDHFASMRISPDSTYKIYEGLMGLSQGIISPTHSALSWDGTKAPFKSWNSDQNLNSAMQNSVNWYFDEIEHSIKPEKVKNYLTAIAYGNKNMSGTSSYWMESSLKISPIEQVLLLEKLNTNQLYFQEEHIKAIKDSICIVSNPDFSLYGKTGTGRINGQDVNGWFIGFIEQKGHVYYFATNIQGNENATGSMAHHITQAIMDSFQIPFT